jgi:protein involved in polysaccharide export with SLBB domain
VEIEVLRSPGSKALTSVGPDGKLYFYLLPGLDVWGLTLTQARDLLQQELGKMVNNPEISVTLRAVGSKHVWLLGRLDKPGIYAINGPVTLLESLAQAGGAQRSTSQLTTEELADLRHSFVVRNGQFLPVNFYRLLHDGDMTQNVYLRPDDFVYVPSARAQDIYVLGAVRTPTAVAYHEPMTLVGAISSANGNSRLDWVTGLDNGPFTKDAYLSHVAVVRGSLSEPQIAVVDYRAILNGKAMDVRLEAGDIVYIPNSPYSTLKRYFNLIINTFVTTVAANEGVRAGGGTIGVTPSVSVGVP